MSMQDKVEYIRVGACEMQAAYFLNRIVYINPNPTEDLIPFYDATSNKYRVVSKYTLKLSELTDVGRIFLPRVMLFDYSIFPPIYLN